MASRFKAIPVMNCSKCPYSQDWSSEGVDCTKIEPTRNIILGIDRTKIKNEIPIWCPLPNVTHAD